MTTTLWEIPVPPNQVGMARIEQMPRRVTRLSVSFETLQDDVDVVEYHDLVFEGTELFSCTYLSSRTVEMIQTAYGKLVDLGQTKFLTQIAARSGKKNLRHLMICFDDGPCYEFVCVGFSHSMA